MTNRRGFFAIVAALFAWRPARPTGSLFNPHADIASQFYQGRKKIGDTITVHRPLPYSDRPFVNGDLIRQRFHQADAAYLSMAEMHRRDLEMIKSFIDQWAMDRAGQSGRL